MPRNLLYDDGCDQLVMLDWALTGHLSHSQRRDSACSGNARITRYRRVMPPSMRREGAAYREHHRRFIANIP
jgi:hypothetical protein